MLDSTVNPSLQQITDAWGKWFATNVAKKSGGCLYTASTNYAAVTALKNNPNISSYISKYQVLVSTETGVKYQNPVGKPVQLEPETVNGSEISNSTNLPQTSTLSASTTTTGTATFNVTQAVSLGVSVSVQAGFPNGAFGGSVSASVDVSLTQSKESSFSKQQDWSVTQPINIEPQHVASIAIKVAEYKQTWNWSAYMLLSRRVAVGVKNKCTVPNHPNDVTNLFFVPIQDVISDCIINEIIDVSAFTVISQDSQDYVQTIVQGTMLASGGTKANIFLNSNPIDGPPAPPTLISQNVSPET